MSGQTIEVLNTDAEGRLVLADALWYCQDRFKPQLMVDLATLTGADHRRARPRACRAFANNDELAERLIAAGKAVGEKLWRLPLADAYDRAIDSDAADVKNIAGGRAAGSIIGAQFLQRFVNKVPWAHLDIAGVAWSKKDAPTVPKGATAFGVRLLDRFVADYYEKRLEPRRRGRWPRSASTTCCRRRSSAPCRGSRARASAQGLPHRRPRRLARAGRAPQRAAVDL